MDLSQFLQGLIDQGGVIAGVAAVGIVMLLLLRQMDASRKAEREAQAPALNQIQSMYEKGQQFLEIQSKTNEVTMARLQRTLDREEADSAQLRKEHLETLRRLASIEAKNEELGRNLEANMGLVTSLQNKINDYEARVLELEQDKADKTRRIEELEAQAIQDRRLIESLQADIRNRTKEIETLKGQLREVETERARVLQEREDRDKKIAHLTAEVGALRAQIDKPSDQDGSASVESLVS